ncbi:MAG: HAMP domain-containing protein [Anaerolineales bacterium]|nr:HAMP domain-containing protein [Anaerolineales bacterium]
MRLRLPQKRPLALRLTLAITIIVVMAVALVTTLTVRRERETFEAELAQQAVLLLDTLSAASIDSLYTLDADYLSDLMTDLGRSGVMTTGRIYDADGRVVADAYDQSQRFALNPDPWGLRLLQSEAPVFEWQEDELIAGRAVVLGNVTIGAVSIGLPTASLGPKLAAARYQGMLVASTAVAFGLLLALLVSRSITDPLQEMIQATQRVSAGDLSQRVAIHTNDELATLGEHFNQMTVRLRRTMHRMEGEIEERKRTQVALEAARDAAEAANRAKSTFLANMSHELRTPLSAVIGYSELMLEQIAAGEFDELDEEIRRIMAAGEHLLMVISDILDLSKIEAGKMELAPERFELKYFVQNVAQTAEVLAQKRGNRLQLTLPDDVGIFYGDRARLRQILLNLLGNAAKFTDNGDIAFGVARDETADGAAWVRFTVADTGIGISSAHLAHLFEPFVQVDPSSTRRYEGTGLGLAISHRFCQMMGGHITVESQVGRGSTFTVHLPVAAVAVSV